MRHPTHIEQLFLENIQITKFTITKEKTLIYDKLLLYLIEKKTLILTLQKL